MKLASRRLLKGPFHYKYGM